MLSRQNPFRVAPFRANVLSSAAINPYSIPSPPLIVVAHDEFLAVPHLRLATIDTNLA